MAGNRCANTAAHLDLDPFLYRKISEVYTPVNVGRTNNDNDKTTRFGRMTDWVPRELHEQRHVWEKKPNYYTPPPLPQTYTHTRNSFIDKTNIVHRTRYEKTNIYSSVFKAIRTLNIYHNTSSLRVWEKSIVVVTVLRVPFKVSCFACYTGFVFVKHFWPQ